MASRFHDENFGDNRWKDQHEWFVAEAKDKEADVLFLGDDHIALLEQSLIYRDHFAPLHCLCFGAFGEEISNLLWRLENKILEKLDPKVIVVSIGNCDTSLSQDEMLSGMKKIADSIKESKPKSKLFFLKLLPSGRRPNKRRNFVSAVNDAMESTLKGVAEVIDVEPSIQGTSGEIDAYDMFDFVHLTHDGYRKIFDPVYVAVSAILNPEG
uniref:SGNH_hydro domain-containing protein n=1 Tax=Syphacia muris TaxID=451379 RepID=A0A0N5AFG1_9BILA